MLIRCLLIICLLIVSAMPICTAEVVSDNTDTLSASNETIPTHSQDAMTMEDALERVTVSAEDWLDGDTYYIRYTFTNLTAVMIDKKVDLTTVHYERCTPNKPFESIHQCNDDLSHLIIPPHSTYETTIALPQHIIGEFNRFTSAKFYFDDNSTLRYGRSLFNDPKPLISITPLISADKNILSLSIYNKSFFRPITKLSDISIALNNWCDPQYTCAAIAGPIFLTINPRDTHTQFLLSLPPTLLKPTTREIKKSSNAYTFFNLPAGLLIHINLKINDIPHVYSASLSMEPPFTPLKKYCATTCFETSYTKSEIQTSSAQGSYYLDDTCLYLYFPIKNHSNETLTAPAHKYEILVSYFNQDTLPKNFIARISLPNDFSVAAHETKYFSCKIPLPYDFYKLDPYYRLQTLYSCQTPPSSELYQIDFTPINAPLSDKQYTPLKLSMILY